MAEKCRDNVTFNKIYNKKLLNNKINSIHNGHDVS